MYSGQIEAKSSQVLYIVYGFEVSFWRGRSGFVDRSSVLEVQVWRFLEIWEPIWSEAGKFFKFLYVSAERGRPAKGRGKLKLSPLELN